MATVWICCLVLGVAAIWAVYTRHAWEDYYITYRASKNLATGHGLTFTAGERVHSFTSPLGVLLPAGCYLLTANSSDTAALWIFRLMGAAALAGAVVILGRTLLRQTQAGPVAVFLTLLVLTDAKTLDFSVNGMETPFLLLFLAWALWALVTVPVHQRTHLGCAGAALMWTRPDAFVYIGGLVCGILCFRPTPVGWRERLGWLKIFSQAGILTSVLYLPWLGWAWSYYGTPIPHTITAKGLFLPKASVALLFERLTEFPGRIFSHPSILAGTFMPAYSYNLGWPSFATDVSFCLALTAILLWLVPKVRWEARVASFVAAVGQFYLYSFVGAATPWYLPPITLLMFVALSLVWGQMWAAFAPTKSGPVTTPRWPFKLLRVGAATLVLGTSALSASVAYQLHYQQKIIEDGQRRGIGQWLHEQSKSDRDTVFLEPLGYIGFYSNLKMFDYPGMSSPEMVAARKRATVHRYPQCWPELIADLQPDWLVLRAEEARVVRERNPDILNQSYDLVRVFDVRDKVDAIPHLPGRRYLEGDAYFEVYHHRSSGSERH